MWKDNIIMKIHEITPKDYTDLHRLYCQLEDDWTSDIPRHGFAFWKK